jgi:CHAT domain-containing protein
MHYATIEEPLDNLQENIPKNTTLVRYLFIGQALYTVLITPTKKQLYRLNAANIKDHLAQLTKNQSDIKTSSLIFYELYQQLWKPFETKITTENVIVFPDGELFNLSFETLTTKKINSFKELATQSLLAKHTISYNYSLLLLDEKRKKIDYKNDFIAFAPEFNDKMKQDYALAITDSVSIDKTYLRLLPQPFSVDVAKEYSQLFNGKYYINERASKQIFKNEAKEHKIIHIGTHAESNNISPELSRLIFAKNSSDEDNSLYIYEIYNENLNSNLAILTACETGKPTYQAGEGMISLAHAFNYAGSESILTSLWKIDEKSSAEIIETFYKNLKKGLPKDKALQLAKLDYISTAEGRTIAPEYWAGLVLIGDTSPIDLNTSSNLLWYFLIALLAITVAFFSLKKRKRQKRTSS